MKPRLVLTISLSAILLLSLLSAVRSFGERMMTDGPALETPYAWDGTYRRMRVPILMYHYVSEPPAGADAIRVNLSVSPSAFAAQMDFLFYEGYTTISFDELLGALLNGDELPPKPVVLTFDDGYVDHYDAVFPVLLAHDQTGVFFIITGMPDQGVSGYLSWPQIIEMAAAGMQMENHTRDHPDLRGRDYEFLVYQLLGATESIAAYTGVTPRYFAYPSGFYDDDVLHVLRSLPAWTAVTTQFGTLQTSDNVLEMPRVRIAYDTSIEGFASLLDVDA